MKASFIDATLYRKQNHHTNACSVSSPCSTQTAGPAWTALDATHSWQTATILMAMTEITTFHFVWRIWLRVMTEVSQLQRLWPDLHWEVSLLLPWIWFVQCCDWILTNAFVFLHHIHIGVEKLSKNIEPCPDKHLCMWLSCKTMSIRTPPWLAVRRHGAAKTVVSPMASLSCWAELQCWWDNSWNLLTSANKMSQKSTSPNPSPNRCHY